MFLSDGSLKQQFESRSSELINATNRDERLIDGIYSLARYAGNSSILDEDHGTDTSYGRAISPIDALRCIHDYDRTFKFVRGLFEAISDVRSRCPDRPVRVLYLGSGPLATLALPICGALSPEDVQFTVADISSTSMRHLELVVEGLGLEDYFDGMIVADATKYEFSDEYDICISETMNRVLCNEPQVAIMDNVRRRIPSASIVLPEEIRITIEINHQGETVAEKDIFSLSRYVQDRATRQAGLLHEDELNVSASIPVQGIIGDTSGLCSVVLKTQVHIYNGHSLQPNESIITADYEREGFHLETAKSHDHINVSYALGGDRSAIDISIGPPPDISNTP